MSRDALISNTYTHKIELNSDIQTDIKQMNASVCEHATQKWMVFVSVCVRVQVCKCKWKW